MRIWFPAAALTVAMGLAGPAQAWDAGDWLVRVGGSNVDPKSDNGSFNLTDLDPINSRLGIDVDDQWGVTFNFTYMYTRNWGIEVLAALPYEHDVKVQGLPGAAATVTHLPPTISLQYHFLPGSAFQPYVGAGLNLTWFMDDSKEEGLRAADLLLSEYYGTEIRTSLDVDSTSFGFAAQAGFDYVLTDQWFVNFDVRYIDIQTDVTLKANGDSVTKTEVAVDPLVYGVHLGYKF
ncbi:MAG: OmpW family outer membrane protein [Gammaproteobacteria bacterium]